jgi:hypothetical protein
MNPRPVATTRAAVILRPVAAMAALVLLAALAGCQPTVPRSLYRQTQADLDQCRQQRDELTRSVEELEQTTARQAQRIETLVALPADRMEQLYRVQRIQFSGRSGGVNTDDAEGDDAVKVYIQPIDQQGSVLKAAGSVRIRAFDLSAPEDQALVADCSFAPDEVGKNWHGGFGVYHFSFECPFSQAPQGDELAVRVEFTDYLTGRTFTQQTSVKVNPGR